MQTTAKKNITHIFTGIIILTLALCLSSLPSCAPSPTEQFQVLKEQGDIFFKKHQYKLATVNWEEALLIPDIAPDPSLYLKLAEAYSRRAAPSKAFNILTNGFARNPSSDLLVLGMAKLHLSFAEIAKANNKWQKTIQNMHTDEGYIFSGDLYSMQGMLEQAEKSYIRALGKKNDNKAALARLAICQLGLQEDEKATATYNQLLALSPDAASILYQIGNFWRIKNDHQKAEHFFKQACSTDPGNLVLKQNLAEYYLAQNRLKESLSITEAAQREIPETSFFDKLHIEILLRLNNLPQSWAELEKLTGKGSLDVEMYLLKGKYFLLDQKPNFAISQFSEAIKKEPTLAASHYFLAVSYYANDKTSLAQQSAIKALSLNPYFTNAELLLSNIFYKKQEYDSAAEHLERIITREPENPRAYMLSGAINLDNENYPKATQRFRQAQILSPTRLAPVFFAALASEKTAPKKQISKSYHRLITKHPEYTGIAARYLSTLQADDEIKRAISFLLEIANKSTHAAEYHEIIALALISSGNELDGLVHLQKAIQINPQQYSSYLHLANYYERQKKWQNLSDILNACLKLQPGNITAIVKLANYYAKRGSNKDALHILNQGLQQVPESPTLANNKAWLLLDTQMETNQAFILARKAYDKTPDDPAIADTLGWAYFHKKMYTRAQWLLEDAIQNAPKEPMIPYHLALAYLATGQKGKAKKLIIQSLKAGLKPPYSTKAEAILNEQ